MQYLEAVYAHEQSTERERGLKDAVSLLVTLVQPGGMLQVR